MLSRRRTKLLSAIALCASFAACAQPPADLRTAARAVDEAMTAGCTDPAVGIWHFPEDGVDVVILPDGDCRTFRITIADSDVPALAPGRLVATLESSAEARTYRLRFAGHDPKRLLKGTRSTACISADGEGMAIKSGGINLRLSPLGMLSGFSRLIRLSVDVPLQNAPDGLLRIYPTYDNAGGSRRRPTIL